MDDYLFPLSDSEFKELADLVYARFGIFLTEQKKTLVAGRLGKHVRELGLESFHAYYAYLLADKTGKESVELINRLTTNHTFFYREKDHFEYLLSDVLPSLRERLGRDRTASLRIWSAGCASGEEPYTLAMTLLEALGPLAGSVDCGILATDLSKAVLESAIHGVYPEAKIRDLPPGWKLKYLEQRGPDEWVVKETVRKMVLFKRLNLMNEQYPFRGQFDIVFCRNVMIYFDQKVRQALVNRIFEYVKQDGFFFVGHSEALPRETCPFSYVKPAVYQKRKSA